MLLLRLQYEKEKIRCEIKPVAVRCDDQRVGAVVLVINNVAREQACFGKRRCLRLLLFINCSLYQIKESPGLFGGRKSLLFHKDYPPISNSLRSGKCSP
jgi:hypothetical protein